MLLAESSNFPGLSRTVKRLQNCCCDGSDGRELLEQGFDGQELLNEIMDLRPCAQN